MAGRGRIRLHLAAIADAEDVDRRGGDRDGGRVPQAAAVTIEGKLGDEIRLAAPRGQIVRWQDFHQAIENARVDGSALRCRLAPKPGHHLVLADVKVGDLPQRQLFKLHISDPARRGRVGGQDASASVRRGPLGNASTWRPVSMATCGGFSSNQYLSPRPKTCSVRLGTDGYSAWTFAYWGDRPPAIDLGNLAALTDGTGRIMTPQRVPFRRFGEKKNIAFTSLWDNWPRSVRVPVGKQAETVWLLVCGSTNPMQTRIANAEIRFQYADGRIEKLALVPPLNFWSLCPFGGVDYDYRTDAFCLPKEPPLTVAVRKQLPRDGVIVETAAGGETGGPNVGYVVPRRRDWSDGRQPDESTISLSTRRTVPQNPDLPVAKTRILCGLGWR